jgi:hypothetical protein
MFFQQPIVAPENSFRQGADIRPTSVRFCGGDAWLEALMPHVERIQKHLGRRIIIGPWGENWVWIAQCLDEEPLTPEHISLLFAWFIQATYQPISLAFQSLGR